MTVVIEDLPIPSKSSGNTTVNETAELDQDLAETAVAEFQHWLQDQSYDPD